MDRCPWRNRDDKQDEKQLEREILYVRDNVSVVVERFHDQVQCSDNQEGRDLRRHKRPRCARGSTFQPDFGSEGM